MRAFFFCHIFPAHFVGLIFSFLLPFLDFLCPFTEVKADNVRATAQAAIVRSSGHSVKEIAKLLKKTERWVNKWSKESLSKTNQGVDGVCFDELCEECNRKS